MPQPNSYRTALAGCVRFVATTACTVRSIAGSTGCTLAHRRSKSLIAHLSCDEQYQPETW
jgi:hypothetical protein